jgi:uncharacterized protein (DUF2147 family)
MRPMQTLFAAAWLALLAVESASAEEPVVSGLWQQVDAATGKTEGWFLFAERDGLFEGRIAKMFMEPGDDPNPRCDRCEGDQKKAPFLGLAIINGMRRHGLEYEDGTILDPRNGTRYRALMHLSPDGQTLVVRGYQGIALLGQDQTWVRLPHSAYAELDPSLNPLAPPGSRPAASKRSQTRSPALR